ncbi:hypothetical protein AWH48_16820 [Domibacillus aminovorans]|uniref:Uncharacterized protein n=1 Tax=Domibacillus aminovorans TaxID=29332 RepID=A0A177KZ75_9BACI|nr:hypothetical protein [Domibacillus aminovorans]OAH58660.1 hypothetical protein AWH48_16820 [Domibacillus aminovorans]
MKEFIIGIAMVLVFTIFTIYQQDSNIHREQMQALKSITQEAAAAAAQHYVSDEYGDGNYSFNEEEGRKAAEAIIRSSLKLDAELRPTSKSYWHKVSKVTYDITFLDHNDFTAFPQNYQYIHPSGSMDFILYGPSVIVTISTGKANYTSIPINSDSYQTGIHTFDE